MGELIYDSLWAGYFSSAGITPDKDPMSLRSVIKLLAAAVGGATPASTAITAVSNAGTIPVGRLVNTFTNSSAATMTITMATTGAADGQITYVRVYDFSAASETITWVNTENGEGTAPTTSNGSTTLPKTAMFMYNGKTSKWRCIVT